jgi:hypothetical protein
MGEARFVDLGPLYLFRMAWLTASRAAIPVLSGLVGSLSGHYTFVDGLVGSLLGHYTRVEDGLVYSLWGHDTCVEDGLVYSLWGHYTCVEDGLVGSLQDLFLPSHFFSVTYIMAARWNKKSTALHYILVSHAHG